MFKSVFQTAAVIQPFVNFSEASLLKHNDEQATLEFFSAVSRYANGMVPIIREYNVRSLLPNFVKASFAKDFLKLFKAYSRYIRHDVFLFVNGGFIVHNFFKICQFFNPTPCSNLRKKVSYAN